MMEIKRTPKIVEWYFNNAIWSSPDNKVWVTFDDGPDPIWTVKFANLLEENNCKGIFFIIGDHVADIAVLKELLSMGHDLGWHGKSHTSFLKLNRHDLLEQFNYKKRFEDRLDINLKYFRFPYGRFLPYMLKIVDAMDMITMFWSYMIYDYKNKPVQKLDSSLKKIKQSDILLLHDRGNNCENTYIALKNFFERTSLEMRKL